MDEEFRGALADVVDGRTWAGYAGPGASVRERGQRRRRRRAATSAAGVVAAVTVVAAGVGLTVGAGKAKPVVPAGASSGTPQSGQGRYVKLTEAAMQPADVGSGYTLGPVDDGFGRFAGMTCAHVAPVSVVGPVVLREFSTTGSAGQPPSVHEQLYQFPDAASARTAFDRTRTAAQAGGCDAGAGSVSDFRDVGGVGDAMFVHSEYGGSVLFVSAAVLEGQVVIVDEAVPGSADAKTLTGGWLTGLSQKAVTRVRNAPRTDVPERIPVDVPMVTLSPGVTNGGPAHASSPLPVSQPVDGFLFAPVDLGPSFTAAQSDEWHTKQIASATSAAGMVFRGTMTGGDGEFMVNEGVYRFTDATAAQGGLAAYRQDTTSTRDAAVSLPGVGDEAWIKRWDTKGGATVAIRSGAEVITFDVLAGGTSADQPIPGGDAWVRQIAHTAVVRLASVK